MSPAELARLRAVAPAPEHELPPGGVERAERLWLATPPELGTADRLAHVEGILRMIAQRRRV